MPVYTVHAPMRNVAASGDTDRIAFVRDGFHLWAALAAPLWLVWHRLWLALIGWIVCAVAIDAGLAALGAGRNAIALANLLFALLTGLEAATVRRWTLSRGTWRQIDVVVADNEVSAERRFFDRWASTPRGFAGDASAIDRGAPPPSRHVPGQPFSRPPPVPSSSIIGSFPEPGGLR